MSWAPRLVRIAYEKKFILSLSIHSCLYLVFSFNFSQLLIVWNFRACIEGLLSGDEGSNGFCTPRVTTFIPSGDESAQRATRDESCYKGSAKPVDSRVKPDSNAITTAAYCHFQWKTLVIQGCDYFQNGTFWGKHIKFGGQIVASWAGVFQIS